MEVINIERYDKPHRPHTKGVDGMRWNLYCARRDKGLTQEEVSKQLYVSRSGYTQIESGVRPGSDTFWAAASNFFEKPEFLIKMQFKMK